MKHTKGKWEIVKCNCGDPVCKTYGTSNGSFSQGCGYSLEDAKLIAEAPEIINTIQKCLDYCKKYPIGLDTDPIEQERSKMIDLIEQTIKNAS